MNRLQMGAELSQMKAHAGSIELGGERAAVIEPLTGKNASDLAHKARTDAGSGADVVEWRVDHPSDISNPVITGCAQALRHEVSLPILATFRFLGEVSAPGRVGPDALVEFDQATGWLSADWDLNLLFSLWQSQVNERATVSHGAALIVRRELYHKGKSSRQLRQLSMIHFFGMRTKLGCFGI